MQIYLGMQRVKNTVLLMYFVFLFVSFFLDNSEMHLIWKKYLPFQKRFNMSCVNGVVQR